MRMKLWTLFTIAIGIWAGATANAQSPVANQCLTPYFWCYMPGYAPVGASCWCASPNGPVGGVVRPTQTEAEEPAQRINKASKNLQECENSGAIASHNVRVNVTIMPSTNASKEISVSSTFNSPEDSSCNDANTADSFVAIVDSSNGTIVATQYNGNSRLSRNACRDIFPMDLNWNHAKAHAGSYDVIACYKVRVRDSEGWYAVKKRIKLKPSEQAVIQNATAVSTK